MAGHFVYVDKTRLLYPLFTQAGAYVFSRPPRFGKSLLLSTLKSVFLAKQAAFKDTWLGSAQYDGPAYPVIEVDLSHCAGYDVNELNRVLLNALQKVAIGYQCQIKATDAPVALQVLIGALVNKVVVLIDGYDVPLGVDKPVSAYQLLRRFYAVLKEQQSHLHVVFATGVGRFAESVVLPGFFTDLSLSMDYALLVGFSQAEVVQYFSEQIESLEPRWQNHLVELIGGYRFSPQAECVYHPYLLLQLLAKHSLTSCRLVTDLDASIAELFAKQSFVLARLEQLRVTEYSLCHHARVPSDPVTLLYQAGYLSIREGIPNGVYTLGYPNQRVELSALKMLLGRLTQIPSSLLDDAVVNMVEAFARDDFQALLNSMQPFFNTASGAQSVSAGTIFYLLVNVMGLSAWVDTRAWHAGYILLATPARRVIFSLGVNQTAKKVMGLLKRMAWIKKYQRDKQDCYLMGLNFKDCYGAGVGFDEQTGGIRDWLVEKL